MKDLSPIKNDRLRFRSYAYHPWRVFSSPAMGIPYLTIANSILDRTHYRHLHSDIQILMVIRGGFDFVVEQAVYPLREGSVLICPPGLWHEVHYTGDAHAHVVDGRLMTDAPRPLVSLIERLQPPRAVHLEPEALRESVAVIAAAMKRTGLARIAAIMTALWRVFEQVAGPVETDLANDSTLPDQRVAQAEDFMRNHLGDSISVEDIADHVRLSRPHLTALFAKYRSIGPATQLRQLRVERAKQLLQRTNLTIKEIALSCGFVCPNHFSRVFSQTAGQTPSAFRSEIHQPDSPA